MNSQIQRTPATRFILLITSFVFLTAPAFAGKLSKSLDEDTLIPSYRGKIPAGLSIENLQVGDTSSRRGRTTESNIVRTTTTPHPAVADSETVLYRLDNRDGRACILLLADAIIEFDYVTNLKETAESSVYVPPVYQASGNCESGDDSTFTISWKNFNWTISFSKTPGGDHWYVERMSVDVDRLDKHLEHINRLGAKLHFESIDQGMLFPTPVGKAYSCEDEVSVELPNGDAKALVILRKLKMQPFIFKKNDFGPEHICSPGGGKSYRDETAPITVGSILAVTSILTVTGYGVYRYMKVKKVQYDTME